MKVTLDKLSIKKLEQMIEKMKFTNIQNAVGVSIMFTHGLLMCLDGTNKICMKEANGDVKEIQFNFYNIDKVN